jgi:hypothetical protein
MDWSYPAQKEKIEERIEVTERRRRHRKQLLDDFKEMTVY